MKINISSKSRFLFIGDSITDYNRREDPAGWGKGYVRFIALWLQARDHATAPVVLNRGNCGDTVRKLDARWDEDVMACEPDLVSVKIGVNDVWARFRADKEQAVPIDEYHTCYGHCLERLRRGRPDCKIVLCEPTIIMSPGPEEGNEALQPYLKAVHSLAAEFRADVVVPLYRAFVDAVESRPDIQWTTDGVHPTPPGDMLIARNWLVSTGLL